MNRTMLNGTMFFRNILAWMAVAMFLTTAAQAQTAQSVQSASPAQPALTAQPAPVEGSACMPNCRNGFFCNSGQCVSMCNPGCESGTICSAQGQCVAPQLAAPQGPSAQPAPNYPTAAYPQPMTRREWRLSRREQRRAEKLRRREERRAERKALGYYRGRLYAAGHFTLGGSGYVDDDRYGYSYDDNNSLVEYTGSENSYGTGARVGLEGGIEFRMGSGFGMGPMVRYSSINHRGTRLFDIMVAPTIHIPFDGLELVIPVQAGITLVWTDPRGDEEDTPGNPDPDGAGFAIGVAPGVIFWPSKSFGINANLGLAAHYIGADSTTNRFYTINLITGINFGY